MASPAPYDQNSPRSFYWLWGLMFGPILFFWQWNEFRPQQASLHWPATLGTVIESSGHGVITLRHRNYYSHVVYRYEINGTSYSSSQICLWTSNDNLWADYNDSKWFVQAHPVGSLVTVYYDPKNFGNAVLIPGPDGLLNVLGMFAGALMVVAAILGIVNGIRSQRLLKAVLNALDAQTRTVRMRKSDIEKGRNGMLFNLVIALGFMAPAVCLLVIPCLRGPVIIPETSRAAPAWLLVAGAVPFALGCLFFVARAARQSRCAECPLCRNNLDKASVKNARCSRCGTHIIFENTDVLHFSHPEKHKHAP